MPLTAGSSRGLAVFSALAVAVVPQASALAQSAQRLSSQLSAFTTIVSANGQRVVGAGAEPQLRFNRRGTGRFGVLSLGVGAQYSRHDVAGGPLTVTGVFVEPRGARRISQTPWFGYWSARAARLFSSGRGIAETQGLAVGVGGGLIRPLSPRVNVDVGTSAVYQSFDDSRTESGTLYRYGGGLAFVARIGLNLGLHSPRR